MLGGSLLMRAANAAVPEDDTRAGPSAGTMAPDFELPDQSSARHGLRSLLGPKGVLLVFFRSADW